MPETVRRILDRKGYDVWSLAPDATVYEAIVLMAEKGVGALPVLAGGDLVGIMSERDYARKVILMGRVSKQTRVWEIMTSPVITVTPDLKADECLQIVTQRHIRHLPVTDCGQMVGMISVGDLVKSIMNHQAEMIEQLTSYIEGRPL
jgi:CBS domain-containing protein